MDEALVARLRDGTASDAERNEFLMDLIAGLRADLAGNDLDALEYEEDAEPPEPGPGPGGDPRCRWPSASAVTCRSDRWSWPRSRRRTGSPSGGSSGWCRRSASERDGSAQPEPAPEPAPRAAAGTQRSRTSATGFPGLETETVETFGPADAPVPRGGVRRGHGPGVGQPGGRPPRRHRRRRPRDPGQRPPRPAVDGAGHRFPGLLDRAAAHGAGRGRRQRLAGRRPGRGRRRPGGQRQGAGRRGGRTRWSTPPPGNRSPRCGPRSSSARAGSRASSSPCASTCPGLGLDAQPQGRPAGSGGPRGGRRRRRAGRRRRRRGGRLREALRPARQPHADPPAARRARPAARPAASTAAPASSSSRRPDCSRRSPSTKSAT